jgi:Tol biopolymer transport system component
LPTGAGRPRMLTSTPGWEFSYRMSWSPDSKSLYVNAKEPNHAVRVYRLEVESGQISPLLPEGIRGAIPSPDSSLLAAYDKNALRIYTAAGKEVRALPELEPGDSMDKWSADGNAILVWNVKGATARLDRIDVVTGKRTSVYEIQPPDPSGIVNIAFCRTTADAKVHVYSEHRLLTDLYVASGLQ